MINTAALLIFTVLLSCGQLLFRHIGLQVRGTSLTEAIARTLLHPAVYAAFLLYGSAMVLWIWILSRVPLAQAYPWVAAGVVIVPLLSSSVFGDEIRPVFWFGAACIVVGILLTQFGVKAG